MATIREKVFLRMKELGVKNKEICAKVGIKEANFSAYINGKRPLPFEDLEKVCMFLGLTLGSVDKVYNDKSN